MRYLLWRFVWRPLSGVILAAVIVAFAPSASVWADQQITDPKQWCDNLMSLVVEKDANGVAKMFAESAGGRAKREDLDAALAPLGPSLAAAGNFRLLDLIAERRYGKSVADLTYAVFFDSVDLFFRCRMQKRGEYWGVGAFFFNTNFDKLELP